MKNVRLLAALAAAGTTLATVAAGSALPASAGTVVRASDWPQLKGGAHHRGWSAAGSGLTPDNAPAWRPAWSEPIEASTYAPNSGSPIIVGSTVVVGGLTVTARSVTSGRLLWAQKLRGSVITTPAWAGRTVVVSEVPDAYGDERFSGVAALDAATGALRWERGLAEAGLGSPTVVGGSVLIGYATGVARLRLADGRVLWRRNLPGGRVSSPTTDGVRVYVSDTGGTAVTALDLRTGARLWRRVAGLGGFTVDGFAPALLRGVVYAAMDGITALNARTGAVLWRAQRGTTFHDGLTTDGRRVIGVSNNTRAVAVDARTGRQLWEVDLQGGDVRYATIAGGVALFSAQSATGTNQLNLIDVATGATLGAIPLPSFGDDLTFTPMPAAVSRGRIAVADWLTLVMLTPPDTNVSGR